MKTPEQIQSEFYTRTAKEYDQMNVQDEHNTALKYISLLVGPLGLASFLDVGAGTGRAVKYFQETHPELKVKGIEPVESLVEQAVSRGIPRGSIEVGRGQDIQYPAASFDAVCAFGVMHHVKRPAAIVSEMMRVARKAVFISDSNRFGQGSMPARRVKLMLWRLGLWGAFNFAKTRGRGYLISEGDGLAYSYSVYDSFDQLAAWADQMLAVPTVKAKAASWSHPLLTASHILLCAIKDEPAQAGS
jgi:SAM-dependent methyltransferase